MQHTPVSQHSSLAPNQILQIKSTMMDQYFHDDFFLVKTFCIIFNLIPIKSLKASSDKRPPLNFSTHIKYLVNASIVLSQLPPLDLMSPNNVISLVIMQGKPISNKMFSRYNHTNLTLLQNQNR